MDAHLATDISAICNNSIRHWIPVMGFWQPFYQLHILHQQKTFLAGRNGSVRVDALRQSRQRHPGGGSLSARRPDHSSRYISPSDRRFTVSSRSVGLLFWTNTLALWPTVTIRRNGFIGYTLASGLQCNRWRCKNLSSRSFYIKLEERRKVRRYDTTRPWGSTQLRGSRT